MKRITNYLMIAATCVFVLVAQSCEPNLDQLAMPGAEIMFKTAMGYDQTPMTKTVYSGEEFTVEGVGKMERIDWVVGDKIVIKSDLAYNRNNPRRNNAEYRVVGVEAERQRSRASITNADGNGLVWAEGHSLHTFYGLYPAPSVTPTTTELEELGVYQVVIPADQSNYTVNATGDTLKPNMNYAYMYAAVESYPASTVNLVFKPAYTAFQITVDSAHEESLTLNNCTLVCLDEHSTSSSSDPQRFTMGGEFRIWYTPKEDPEATTATYSYGGEHDGDPFISFGESGYKITKGHPVTFTFFTRPKDYEKVKIVFNTNVGEKVLEFRDDANNWVPFKGCKKYNINIGGIPGGWTYEMNTIKAVTTSYKGGTGVLNNTFISYRHRGTLEEGNYQAEVVPYTLEYSSDNGTTWEALPDWLTVSSGGSGSIEGQRFAITLAQSPVTATYPNPHTTALRSATSVSNKDLSLYNVATGTACARSTANCYVVDAPGTYYFPLVYGNAIVNGTVNPSAYTAPAAGELVLEHFLNAKGTAIESPYILTDLADDYSSPSVGAALLWTDAQNLVSNVHIGTNTYNGTSEQGIFFSVPSGTICQGNAAIALTINGEIVWSWHIWVTDTDLTQTENFNGFDLASWYVGWCDSHVDAYYASRTCLVRAVQDISGNTTAPVTVKQKEGYSGISDNQLFYEWGRKDPFAAIVYDPFETGDAQEGSKEYYFGSSLATDFQYPMSLTTIEGAIKNPCSNYWDYGNAQHYTTPSGKDAESYDWCEDAYCNLWNTTATKTSGSVLTKSVYDPSPVGFEVMPAYMYSGYVSTDFYASSNHGFTPGGVKATGNIRFPWTGIRIGNYAMGYGWYSPVWTSGYTPTEGYRFAHMMLSDEVELSLGAFTAPATSCAVRPVIDKFSVGANAMRYGGYNDIIFSSAD